MAALVAADYIEPDLVLSKDGVLMVVYNEWLGDTTNVANLTQFADRKKQVQDNSYPYRPQYFNKDFSVLRFDEYLDHIESLSKTLDRPFGVIPELKSPEVFNALFPAANGRGYEVKLLEIMTKRNYTLNQPPPLSPVMQIGDLLDKILNIKPKNYDKPNYKLAALQSFDSETCEYLGKNTKIPIVSLDQNKPWMYTHKGLDKIASYSKILSPAKDLLLAGPAVYFEYNKISYNKTEIESMGGFLQPKDLVREAHKRRIELSPYTLPDSRQPSGLLCTKYNDTRFEYCPENRKEEMFYFFDLGCDYVFVENIFEAQILCLAFDNKIDSKDC
ncbi:hypothetical protein BB561_006785 [Smittium simulii]|uniref:glycerophosphodiester phosphodiesterase n=1 Tax=Smittium simulii TaxID=133385 RepID=A0A2T9Y1I1_9FUNG|nr:hypothetical protein BB561_006785 [Smittium simulii]